MTLLLVLDGVDYGKDTPSKEAPPLDLTEHLLDAVPDGLLTLLLGNQEPGRVGISKPNSRSTCAAAIGASVLS